LESQNKKNLATLLETWTASLKTGIRGTFGFEHVLFYNFFAKKMSNFWREIEDRLDEHLVWGTKQHILKAFKKQKTFLETEF
jgi:hypothetical protein